MLASRVTVFGSSRNTGHTPVVAAIAVGLPAQTSTQVLFAEAHS